SRTFVREKSRSSPPGKGLRQFSGLKKGPKTDVSALEKSMTYGRVLNSAEESALCLRARARRHAAPKPHNTNDAFFG
ncbi:hypothetical protein, partial [Burkholderia cenocepacia]|uniref:hypothetical protein n=1 Tax=Burkholderia cenocepacia TaxID=95486 RepID=UPI002237FDB6